MTSSVFYVELLHVHLTNSTSKGFVDLWIHGTNNVIKYKLPPYAFGMQRDNFTYSSVYLVRHHNTW